MSLLIVPVIMSDFEADNAIIRAMKRLNYGLTTFSTLHVGRNGMDYVTERGETWQLSTNQYAFLRANIPMTYSLRYEGIELMTVQHFNTLCTIEQFNQEYDKDPGSRPWYNFWKRFRGE